MITRARSAAEAGRRAEAVAMLKQHLAASPDDVDARLMYGLVLSWEGEYDEARAALSAVLAAAPDYLDARIGLMNVEWWSGRLPEARELNRSVLAREPGNAQARLVQQRLDARTRPWTFGVSYTSDTFSDDREPWHEASVTMGRETPVGPLLVRGSGAQRFGIDDRQVDVEFYPTFRAGTYAFIGVGAAPGDALYPGHRMSFELYQSIGRGFEISGGVRHLAFDDAATIYLGTLTKYAGSWMLTGKAQVVPDQRLGDAWSYHAGARRYFGAAGTSFVGAGYSHGFTREEPRGQGDILRVDGDTVRGQSEIDLRERLRMSFHVSGTRQQRAAGGAFWQTTAGAGFTVKF